MQASTVRCEPLPRRPARRPRGLPILAALVVVAHAGLLMGLPFAARDEMLRGMAATSTAPWRAPALSLVPPRVVPSQAHADAGTIGAAQVDAPRAPPATAATAQRVRRAPARPATASPPAPLVPPEATHVAPPAATPAATVAAPGEPTASPTASDAADTHHAAEPADPPWPTRVPASAELHYLLRRGDASGEARVSWRVDGERYALALRGVLPAGREIDQHSQGGFDAAGVAPQRLADRRRGREVRAANFQREHGKISFSGPGWELPLHAGTQDRLSWLVQLVAIAGAAPGTLVAGRVVSIPVVGTRGALYEWRFEVRGAQRVTAPHGAVDALWLVREPVHPYDLRVEVWLDPSRGHWPAQLRQTQLPGGEPLEWILRDDESAREAPDEGFAERAGRGP